MKNFIHLMQIVAANVLESKKPMLIRYGTVLSISPLKIKLSQKEIFEKEFFVVKEGEGAFQVGDELILLRDYGGQKYLIWGKKGVL